MQFWDRLCVQVLVGTFSLLLAGCHNDGSRVGPSVLLLNQQAVTLSGSVGDGPVADASLELRDRTGDVVANGYERRSSALSDRGAGTDRCIRSRYGASVAPTSLPTVRRTSHWNW